MRGPTRPPMEINRDVRRILVSHWLDLGRLSLRTVKDSVCLRGSLERLPGAPSELTPAIVEAVHTAIRNTKDVRNVHIELDNWALDPASGAWRSTRKRKRRRGDAGQEVRPGGGVYNIRD